MRSASLGRVWEEVLLEGLTCVGVKSERWVEVVVVSEVVVAVRIRVVVVVRDINIVVFVRVLIILVVVFVVVFIILVVVLVVRKLL